MSISVNNGVTGNPGNAPLALLRPGNVGTRILGSKTASFDNTTIKTFRMVVELAATGFDAVRPIFANGAASTYTVASGNAYALADMAVGAFPTPTACTFPAGGVVPVALLAANRNSYMVGNWVNLPSVPRTDGGVGAIVCFDAYITTAAAITVWGDASVGWATRAGRKYLLRYNNGDCVTTPANFVSTTNQTICPMVGVQYVAKGKVTTVMGIGDSITYGMGTIGGEGFGTPACEQAQAATGAVYEWSNLGVNGQIANYFSQYLADLASYGVYPDIVVTPNASPNGMSVPITQANIDSAHGLLSIAERDARANQVRSILWTILPTNPAVKAYQSSDSFRVALNANTKTYSNNTVLDFATAMSGVTDGNGQVNMLAGATTDGIHPNDLGNAMLAPILSSALQVFA